MSFLEHVASDLLARTSEEDLFLQSAARAREIAAPTLEAARKAVGLR